MSDRLSLIAGTGALVTEVLAAARKHGLEVQVLSASPRRFPAGVSVVPIDPAAPGPALDAVRAFGATMLSMVGAVSLADSEREALGRFAGAGGPATGDTALSNLAAAFERHTGARLVGIREIAPQLLAPDGPIAGPSLSAETIASATFAVRLARAAGRLDLGQAVVVSGRRAVALEDISGTDALLRRVAGYRRRGLTGDGGSVLVLAKAAKPDQPLGIDLPAIGPATIAKARTAGIAIIAVQAGATVLIQRSRLVASADAAQIAVVGVPADDA